MRLINFVLALAATGALTAALLLLSAAATTTTFVYESNAEEGDIGLYLRHPEGPLQPGPRFKADKLETPMAVSRDKRFLVAAVRSRPYLAYPYSIHGSGG